MRQCNEKVFLDCVKDHKITAKLDNGIYRHIRLASNSWNQAFDIITWPGYLAYTGDMGSYTFSRVEDMFTFFRDSGAGEIKINPYYWSEKLQSVDRTDGYKEYASSILVEHIEDHVKDWIEDYELDDDQAKELRDAINEDVLRYSDDGEHDFREAINDFSLEMQIGDLYHKFEFSDTWEWNSEEFTYRYIWCCYAIVWSIRKYDELKKSECAA